MADGTKIEWTDATWNPVTGCSVVSPGCTHCYAMKLAGTRLRHHPTRAGLTHETKAGPVWNGEVRFNEKQLLEPLGWKRPRMIFVCAHGDLFHESVPDEWIDQVFAVMALCPQHTFQVLTKRPERMRAYLQPGRATPVGMEALGLTMQQLASNPNSNVGNGVMLTGDIAHLAVWPLPNVWLGTSVEDQRRADERIPHLLRTPAAVRFLSAEPLLGPVDLTLLQPAERDRMFGFELVDSLRGVHSHVPRQLPSPPRREPTTGLAWVIVGGESGPGARPMHPEWARSLRDQCAAAGVPFFFKQWGNWADFTDSEPKPVTAEDRIFTSQGEVLGVGVDHGRHGSVDPAWRERGAAWMGRVSKSYAGRLLDGVEHNGMPEHR